jgi:hypothetical protein
MELTENTLENSEILQITDYLYCEQNFGKK